MSEKEIIERKIFLKRQHIELTENEIHGLEKKLKDLSDEKDDKEQNKP